MVDALLRAEVVLCIHATTVGVQRVCGKDAAGDGAAGKYLCLHGLTPCHIAILADHQALVLVGGKRRALQQEEAGEAQSASRRWSRPAGTL
jgi:hypothetical protein